MRTAGSDQFRAVGPEISLNRGDAAEADGDALLALKEPIMGKGLAHFHDFDVFVLHLPKLAFGQWNDGELFGLHTFTLTI